MICAGCAGPGRAPLLRKNSARPEFLLRAGFCIQDLAHFAREIVGPERFLDEVG